MNVNTIPGTKDSSDFESKEEVRGRIVRMNNMHIDLTDEEVEEFQDFLDDVEVFEDGEYFTPNLLDQLPFEIKKEPSV